MTPRQRQGLLLAGAAAAGVINFAKGFRGEIFKDAGFYWLIDYQHGFIKRALLGTLVHPVTSRFAYSTLAPAIVFMHAFACFCIIVMLAMLFRRAYKASTTAASSFLLLMCGPLIPTLAWIVGYLDIYVILIALTGFWFVLDERYPAAALLAAVGPLVHEGFVFVWSSIGILLAWSCVVTRRRVAAKMIAAIAPVVSALLVAAAHSPRSAAVAIQATPLPEAIQQSAILQMSFALPDAFDHMRRYEYPGHWQNLSIAVAYFVLPAAIIVFASLGWRRSTPTSVATTVVAAAAILSPLVILALAWDLSRFLVWSNLAAAIVMIAAAPSGLLMPTAAMIHTARRRVGDALLIVTAVFYLFSPAIFAYFSEVWMSYERVPKWFAGTPPALATFGLFGRYNDDAPAAARLNLRLACYLSDEGTRRLPGCGHEIRAGETVRGPVDLKLPSDRYSLHLAFASDGDCASAYIRVQAATAGRFGSTLTDQTRRITTTAAIDVPFQIDLTEAALGTVEFTVTGIDGCTRLTEAHWDKHVPAR